MRLLCLLSITHDGLGEDLYTQVIRHIQHAVGFSIYPMLAALRRLRLLYPRRSNEAIAEKRKVAQPSRSTLRLALTPAGAEKLATATERLIKRRKSTYKYIFLNE